MSVSRPAVFLDRDGTLNRHEVRDGKPYPPAAPEDFVLFEGVAQACKELKKAGFVLVVATNQPDVGRGTQSREAVEAMHEVLIRLIPEIDRIEVSYDPGNGIASESRKPAPGMLLSAARSLNLDLSASWMIGDRWRDVDCGKRAGVRTIFIDHRFNEELRERPDFVVASFSEAASIILEIIPLQKTVERAQLEHL